MNSQNQSEAQNYIQHVTQQASHSFFSTINQELDLFSN